MDRSTDSRKEQPLGPAVPRNQTKDEIRVVVCLCVASYV